MFDFSVCVRTVVNELQFGRQAVASCSLKAIFFQKTALLVEVFTRLGM